MLFRKLEHVFCFEVVDKICCYLISPLANRLQCGLDKPTLAGMATIKLRIRSSQSVLVLICSLRPCILQTISVRCRQTRKVLVVYFPKKWAIAWFLAAGLRLGRTVIAVKISSRRLFL